MANSDAEIAIGYGVTELWVSQDSGEVALEKLYDQYARALYRYALTLVGSPEDAEDAVQEVFVRMAREMGRLRRVESIKAYMFAATRNAAFSVLRGRRRRDVLREAACAEYPASGWQDMAGRVAELAQVRKAFSDLPADQREVLVLKLFEEMTFKEIAEAVGVPPNTAASRYRYAIEKLRQAVEENGNE